ncbi:MAG: ABC transporter substrate-binding protein [Candidatus Tectomicrobia bacterium]|nr:ABC transporter substrate-binding protein [Candidatus Tectomicrobia bacterium]
MFHWRWSKDGAKTGSIWRGTPEERGPVCNGRWLRVGTLLVVVALALLACSDDRRSTAPGSPGTIADRLRANADAFQYIIGQPGGTLTVATASEPLTLNLALANDGYSSNVLGYLFEGLTEASWLTDEVEPVLAESWSHSEDGLEWTFYLRKDVIWHDGTPLTAHDVVFTFNDIIYNPDIQANARAAFNFRFPDEETGAWKTEPMTVTALDDHTVRCELPVPFAPFLRSMGTAIYPRHILQPYVDEGTFTEVWGIDSDPAEVIGTGPFTIVRYDPGERVVLQRNPGYWLSDDAGNPLPYLDAIVHAIVPDLETELASFKAGDSDVYSVPGEEFAELEALQAEGDFTIHRRGPGFNSEFLTFNMNPGAVSPAKLSWFENTRFRQAVAHSVDRRRIIDEVLNGLGYPQWSSVSPAAGAFHNPDVRRHEYDIAKANRLLDELGWVDTDGDGFREDESGNRVVFSLVTNTGNSVREEIGTVIQHGLTDIGVETDYMLIDFGDLVARLTATYDWDAVIIGFTGESDPYSGIGLWHSSEALHLWHPNQTEPATEWEAGIDDLYIRAGRELDEGERVKLYHRAQAIAAENLPLIYTAQAERLSAVRNVFGNLTPTLYGLWDIRYLYRTDG